MTDVLAVERVTKSFGGLRALSDLSFGVREGEILGLIGPNGSGKTTLFNCISEKQEMTATIANRGYVLRTGEIVMEGAAGDLLKSEGIRRAYLGEM